MTKPLSSQLSSQTLRLLILLLLKGANNGTQNTIWRNCPANFLALFFDPMDGVFKWDVISGVCEEVYDYEGNASDESLIQLTMFRVPLAAVMDQSVLQFPKLRFFWIFQHFYLFGESLFLWSTQGKGIESRSIRRLPTLPRLLVS